jgi:hypothetical protein
VCGIPLGLLLANRSFTETPQAFTLDKYHKAFLAEYHQLSTDDVKALETLIKSTMMSSEIAIQSLTVVLGRFGLGEKQAKLFLSWVFRI